MPSDRRAAAWIIGAFLPALLGGALLAGLLYLLFPTGDCADIAPLTDASCLVVTALPATLLPGLALVLLARRLGWRNDRLYLSHRHPVRSFAVGALAGLALPALPLLAGLALGALEPGPSGDGAASIAVILLLLTTAALAEELLFRSALLSAAESLLGPRGALLLTSLLFALLHAGNPGVTSPAAFLTSMGGVFLAGLLLGLVTQRSGSIWAAWGLHLTWNASIGVLYGLQVSGIRMPALMRVEVNEPGLVWGAAFGPESGLVWQGVWLIGITGLVLLGGARGLSRPRPDPAAPGRG